MISTNNHIELLDLVLDSIKKITAQLQITDPHQLNERYIHHVFSYLIQLELGDSALITKGCQLLIHPEWPTWKDGTRINYAKYKKSSHKEYYPVPVEERGFAGYIDFALGEYNNPSVGVEFSLRYGRSHLQKAVFDFIKLLDIRNPFKAGVYLNITLRQNGLVRNRELRDFELHMNTAYADAKKRLNNNISHNRDLYFFIAEISNGTALLLGNRRQWKLNPQTSQFVQVLQI